MIKFEYIPWKPTFADASEPSPVKELTMTLSDSISWDEAVCEFQNFLRAAGYVIQYDFEDEGNTSVASVDESNTDVAENRKRDADLKIGAWLSAALEDPSTCQSMKDDINEWFECTPQVHRNTMHP